MKVPNPAKLPSPRMAGASGSPRSFNNNIFFKKKSILSLIFNLLIKVNMLKLTKAKCRKRQERSMIQIIACIMGLLVIRLKIIIESLDTAFGESKYY